MIKIQSKILLKLDFLRNKAGKSILRGINLTSNYNNFLITKNKIYYFLIRITKTSLTKKNKFLLTNDLCLEIGQNFKVEILIYLMILDSQFMWKQI